MNIQIPNISKIIVDNLRKEIIKGKLRPGAKINVDNLVSQFKISKTPIRESLKILEAEGLLEFIPRSGWKVSKLSKKEFLDLCEIQEILEVYLSVQVVNYVDLINFDELEQINSRIKHYIEMEEIYHVFYYNQSFHTNIYKVYPNSQILKYLYQIWNKINRQRNLMVTSGKFLNKIVSEHEDIIQSLKEKNVEKIEKNMHQHFNTGRMALYEDFNSEI